MRKKISVFGLSAVLLLSSMLAACSGDGANPAGSGQGASNETVTLEFWGRWDAATKNFNETIEAFQQEYPNIKVNYTLAPSSQYVQQIQSAISGGNLPDIFANVSQLPTYQLEKLNVLHPLDDIFTEEERASFYDGVWSEGSTVVNGSIYSIPLYTPMRGAQLMYYNKAVMERAGLTEADVPKSWDEMYSFSKKVREGTNGEAYGVVVGVKAQSFLPTVLAQMATAITPEVTSDALAPFNYKTGKYEFNSPGLVQSLEFIKKLQDDELLHPNSIVMNFREATGLFEAGQAALTFDGAWYAPQLPRELLEQVGVAPIPTKDGKPQYATFSGGSGDAYHVSKDTKHYEEVKTFIRYMAEHLYVKNAESGIAYSPIASQNENLTIANPVSQQALKVESQLFKLVPRPFVRNPETLKIATEMSGKGSQVTLASIAEGYLVGQIQDVNDALTQLSNATNKLFAETMEKVRASGGNVSDQDYIFPNWTPNVPYVE